MRCCKVLVRAELTANTLSNKSSIKLTSKVARKREAGSGKREAGSGKREAGSGKYTTEEKHKTTFLYVFICRANNASDQISLTADEK